jgi:hypothetical protein
MQAGQMEKAFRFECSICGEMHEGAPSVAFGAPDDYLVIPENERGCDSWLSSDFCVVEGRDRYIRCTLEFPIHDYHEGFLWGVWISVSEKNFEDYRAHFSDDGYQARYVGWLGNRLPGYRDTREVIGAALLRGDGQRPAIELEPSDHPLVVDFANGISWERASDLLELIMHPAH